jgi:putative flippase GtrA
MERLHSIAPNHRVAEITWFLVVGGLSALLYIVIGAGLTVLGLQPSVALLLTLSLLIPPTYLAQRRWTFRSDLGHSVAFPRYLTTQLTGNGVGLLGTAIFPGIILRQPFVAFAIVAIGVATLNYGCLKLWAFRR